MGVLNARDRRVNACYHLEWPVIGIPQSLPGFKPRWRSRQLRAVLAPQACGLIEVVVNPIRVTIEILNGVQRSSKCLQNQYVASGHSQTFATAVFSQCPTGVLEKLGEDHVVL